MSPQSKFKIIKHTGSLTNFFCFSKCCCCRAMKSVPRFSTIFALAVLTFGLKVKTLSSRDGLVELFMVIAFKMSLSIEDMLFVHVSSAEAFEFV